MNNISLFNKNKVFNHFKTLIFGSSFSFLINIFSLLVFSKLYTKEQFGVYALFVSAILLASVLSSLRLNDIIVLQKSKIEAATISYVSTKVTLFFSVIFLLLSIGLFFFSIPFFNAKYIIWLFIPPTLYSLGVINIFLSWNNKIKEYKIISFYRSIQSLGIAFFGILFGFVEFEIGLILAYSLGVIISSLYLWLKFKQSVINIKFEDVTILNIKLLLIKNRDIINYSFGLSFFITLIKTIPNFILNFFFGSGIVGVYDMSLKVLNIPKSLISTNIGELFYQKGSVFNHKYQNKFKKITIKTTLILVVISFVSYLPFMLFGTELFTFFLGSKWVLAGEFSKVISFWYFILFITSPMAYVFYIKRILNKLFWITSLSFVIKISCLYYFAIHMHQTTAIYYYTYICVLLELILLLIILKTSLYNTYKK